ncbi:hypothetical protein RHCRD62_10570 [Rhodococcus sp. RD6.2]|nr:hypothetical protein RHCRD62_10570 [Rhodococcus sp. RD6.2]
MRWPGSISGVCDRPDRVRRSGLGSVTPGRPTLRVRQKLFLYRANSVYQASSQVCEESLSDR